MVIHVNGSSAHVGGDHGGIHQTVVRLLAIQQQLHDKQAGVVAVPQEARPRCNECKMNPNKLEHCFPKFAYSHYIYQVAFGYVND